MRTEQRLALNYIDRALANGYEIGVEIYDTTELEPTTDRAALRKAIGTGDDFVLRLRKDGESAGWLWYIMGNGSDNPSDMSVNAPDYWRADK